MVLRKSLFAVLFAALGIYSAFGAMEFYPAPTKANPDKTKMLYSSCAWFSDTNFEAKPMTNPPMKNDKIIVRAGGYFLTADKDVELQSIWIADSSGLAMDSHSLKLKKNFEISVSCNPKRHCRALFNKSRIEIGGNLGTRFFERSSQASFGILRLEDSVMEVDGSLNCILSVNTFIADFKNRAGFRINMVGDSKLSFGNGALIDSIFVENPKRWGLFFDFEEKNGKMPRINIDGDAEIKVCDISLKLSDKIKPGTYTLIDFLDKKSGIGKILSLSVNGKQAKLGEGVKIGSKTAFVNIAAASSSKDSRTKNDLVLVVK